MRARARCSLSRLQGGPNSTESGWTLVEMLMAILLSSLVLGAASALLSSMASLNVSADKQVTAADTARTAMENWAAQLRNAAVPPGAQRPVYSVGSWDLQFYQPSASASLTNNPRGLQWVRYCLDYTTLTNEKLWMQTNPYNSVTSSTPPATSACPAGTWATQRVVAQNLINNASISGGPCATPNIPLFANTVDGLGGTRDVLMRLVVQGDPNKTTCAAVAQRQLASSVQLRNYKGSPTPALTCSSQNLHAICDASGSSDPDGEALAYKWKIACCSTDGYTSFTEAWEAGQTNYIFDHGALTYGKTYTVFVEVTNASSAFADGSTTVTIQ